MQQLPNFDKELSEERDAAEALGEVGDLIHFSVIRQHCLGREIH